MTEREQIYEWEYLYDDICSFLKSFDTSNERKYAQLKVFIPKAIDHIEALKASRGL